MNGALVHNLKIGSCAHGSRKPVSKRGKKKSLTLLPGTTGGERKRGGGKPPLSFLPPKEGGTESNPSPLRITRTQKGGQKKNPHKPFLLPLGEGKRGTIKKNGEEKGGKGPVKLIFKQKKRKKGHPPNPSPMRGEECRRGVSDL